MVNGFEINNDVDEAVNEDGYDDLNDDDLKFYNKFSEDYKDYLKSQDFSTEKLDPLPAKDGSFELWCYYHLGGHPSA